LPDAAPDPQDEKGEAYCLDTGCYYRLSKDREEVLYSCGNTSDKVLQISSPENPNLSLLKFVFALVVVALVAIGCGSDSGGGGGGGGCFISAIDGNQT